MLFVDKQNFQTPRKMLWEETQGDSCQHYFYNLSWIRYVSIFLPLVNVELCTELSDFIFLVFNLSVYSVKRLKAVVVTHYFYQHFWTRVLWQYISDSTDTWKLFAELSYFVLFVFSMCFVRLIHSLHEAVETASLSSY